MPFQLRSGNTGIPLVPNVDAVTLIWSAALQAWDFGTAGAVEPLTNVRFVDGSTAVPLADQDGSIAAPFATVQAALDALVVVAAPNPVVLLAPGDYSAEVLNWIGETMLQISSLSNAARGFQSGFVNSARIGSISGDFGIALTGIQHGDVDGGFGDVILQGTIANGPVTLTSNGGLVVGFGCFLGGVSNINAFNVRFTSCELQDVNMTLPGGLVEVTNTNWTVGADVLFTGAPGSLRLDSMTHFYFLAMGGAATVTNGAIVPLYPP